MRQKDRICVAVCGLSTLLAACSSGSRASSNEAGPLAMADDGSAIPEPGLGRRVGGNLVAAITGGDGDYRSGACRIDTPLPEGYPAPTPPEAIDLKTYPAVRRAVVRGERSPDSGMNRAFWPLFEHIKSHDIAMTSPVEMDYRDLSAGSDVEPKDWSMAFLYRTKDLNAAGREGRIEVEDAAPVTVLAVGMKGDYSMELVRGGMETIEAWLAANPGWRAAGSWRSLYYNGPALLWWNKWAEVQMPVRASSGGT